MTIPARLKSHLDEAHVSYSQMPHVPIHSAQYAGSLIHSPGEKIAKTVVLRGGENNLLAVLPASYHINLKKLSALVGTPVGLLEEKECNKLFPDCEPGTVPPFGELYRLPVYLDEALAEDLEIIFSVGTSYDAIRMGNANFVRLVKPQLGSFAERLWTI